MAASAVASTRTKARNGLKADTLSQSQATLLPYNRKLRNLRSISLRNLSLETATPGRPRGQTIDDDADPRAYASPAKLRALREEHALEHSHSSGDLRHQRALSKDSGEIEPDKNIEHGSPASKRHMNGGSVRKRPGRPRRRSTLDWANASAIRRQEKLEHVKEDRMANVFFSLYVEGLAEPIYISETSEQTMDPTFRSIDLSACDTSTLRESAVMIRFWAQSLASSRWSLVREWHVRLENLHFLTADFGHASLAFEKNTLLFQFSDGIYVMPTMMPFVQKHSSTETLRVSRPSKHTSEVQRRTSSFDALLKLGKLTESIEDALAIRNKLATQLESLLQANKSALEERDHVTEHQDRCKTIIYARDMVTKQIGKARKQLAEKRTALERRRALLSEDRNHRQKISKEMKEGREELSQLSDERLIRKTAISAQQRRVVEDLFEIFAINSAGSNKALAFKIRALRLPNAEELDSVPSAEVSASLGLVAQATQLMSFYLGLPLPYHVHLMGSTSWITDPISLVSGTTGAASVIASALRATEDKVYPLHQSRVARFRFDYGVFLLNKDIQLLLESGFGVRVLDIRHTLPNLKYLLYVASAGEGELPARKAGGIRGLLKQSPRASLSRGSSSGSLPGWIGIVAGKEEKKEATDAAQSLRQLVRD